MRYIRYVAEDAPARWGVAAGGSVEELDAAPYAGGRPTGRVFPLDSVQLLAPVEPSKIVCIGRNYQDHAAELGNVAPPEPMFFLKAPSALIGPGEAIVLPHPEHTVHWEAELAVVVGRRMKNVAEEDALQYVFGYTIANDVSDRDFQRADAPFGFGRAKSFDTFCPCGPAVVTAGIDPSDALITLTCNDEVRQSGSTRQMLHPVPKLLSHLSHIMTLLPGDLVLTGTPRGVGAMRPGDLIEIHVPGIGTLANPVV
ncbi:2-keto-4-pentenoate hydratase/2-oxohepta-3-ene-1,7-dioic acid hydratase in catechol pathway [Symbiobacterium terraclitae]|uniref:2-keto-4-pentenoate hydratase/2-oxohepta-3-ene-1,7-dioic acid hydratase in catechol pathway n=1 Tax=Symbiobacterium terraclitae TaxID=557451 RepID=A0ABS4JPZ5_9FIRM|nr:fumarylacetoacetate hydrolase family protein [Symbiobacterium terraclitae]MBP2017046.1 2-keto-4-pentenoate hydratase/2-oxohepta-3-ene-1,7-dioic acid hydratase in catechol pathway [Symbiobacterium terraclitae]